jgi:hypothetical protein
VALMGLVGLVCGELWYDGLDKFGLKKNKKKPTFFI